MVAFVAALGVISLVIVLGNASLASREANNSLSRDRAKWMDSAAADLRSRYFRNAADQISAESGLPESTVLAVAGVHPKWGARVLLTPWLTEPVSGVRYATAVLWMPGLHDTGPNPAFDILGTFNICPGGNCPKREYRLISGLEAQRTAVARTLRTLETLAAKASTFAKAQYLRDPEHDLSRNPFRVADCSVPEDARPPCLDDYTDIANAGNLRELMGIDPNGLTDAWGAPITAHNGAWDPSAAPLSWMSPPYSMAFKATSPWGADLLVVATQSL